VHDRIDTDENDELMLSRVCLEVLTNMSSSSFTSHPAIIRVVRPLVRAHAKPRLGSGVDG
jgi:hypothetical protein